MAGQGLNLGLADAAALARAVLDGRRSGSDVGSSALLSQYERERKVNCGDSRGVLCCKSSLDMEVSRFALICAG